VNIYSLMLGVAAVVFGAYTAWARKAKPEQFRKLEPMKRLYGERAGVIVHTIGYTVVPIVYGLLMIIQGLQGKSIFELR
jgi:hypothetical protein